MTRLKNPYLLAYLILLALAVWVLVRNGVYAFAEPFFIFLIFGLVLPGVAYFFSGRCEKVYTRIEPGRLELLVMAGCLLLVVSYLVWGSTKIDALVFQVVDRDPRFEYLLDLIKKLLVFVIIPYGIFSRWFGYSWRDFGLSLNLRNSLSPPYLALLGVMFVLYFLIQTLVGQAAQPLFSGDYASSSIFLGVLVLYPLLALKVGIVEEFFFRAILQGRLSAWLKSETAGIVLMALIFGLAHAPGLYLRGAGAVTALGQTPDLSSSVAYSIAILSLAGLAFGVIWSRTRNLLVLVLIHAWVDLPPSLPKFIDSFGL